MATEARTLRPAAGSGLLRRVSAPRWTAQGWGAIGLCALFVAITWWWLTQDRTIPIYDSGLHLLLAIDVHDALAAGEIGLASEIGLPYPPFVYLIGSLGFLLGGIGVTPAILAQNFVFLPLLVLGCYHTGRLAFGRTAGLLAVAFALGSPLNTAQFHVFMTDAPDAAMVAAAVWLIIASRGFTRLGYSAAAGLLCGLGMLTKEPFVMFVAGPLAVAAVRGALAVRRGDRGPLRGVLAFSAILLALALPWYISEYSRIHELQTVSLSAANQSNDSHAGGGYKGDVAPARFSLDNFQWYFWNMINYQLYLPLFAFAAVGWVWMCVRVVRRRHVGRYAPELMVGAFVSWFAITETFVHDTRYSMPLLVYLAVIGTGWIVQLPGRWRIAAAAALVAVVAANTLTTTFGLGKTVVLAHGGTTAEGHATTLQHRGQLVVFSNEGFQVAGPKRDGDMLGVLTALRREGVQGVVWNPEQAYEPAFSTVGITVLARIVHLAILSGESKLDRHTAAFVHETIVPGEPPPCVPLYDGTGVWIFIGDPKARGARYYCPVPEPHYYGAPRG